MILPIAHDRDTVRRVPWASFGLIGGCLAVFATIALTGVRPLASLGFVPADPSPWGLVTHPFVESGALRLFGNLLLLYLAGPLLEDVWGRPTFVALFLGGGAAAAAGHAVLHPGSTTPLIGASGAVAALLGAFLVRFRGTEIRYFYWFWLLHRGTFTAPAWTMLPLWFMEQLVMALLLEGGGLAAPIRVAHVAGFLFGVAFAGAVRGLDAERRWLGPAIEAKISARVLHNPLVDRALEAEAAGAGDRALRLLRRRLRRDPGDRDAALAFWSAAAELGRAREAVPAMLRLLHDELRDGQDELAAGHWRELARAVPDVRCAPDLLVRLGAALDAAGDPRAAASAFRRALLDGDAALPSGSLLRIARIARPIDPGLASGAARLALERPEVSGLERRLAVEIAESEAPAAASQSNATSDSTASRSSDRTAATTRSRAAT